MIEVILGFFLFLSFMGNLFLVFWVRNLIRSLSRIANNKSNKIYVTNEYLDKLNEVFLNDHLSGEPIFRELKVWTEEFREFLKSDEEYEEIEYLIEDGENKNQK